MTPAELYLDLLKKTLTDTLHGREPDARSGAANPRYVVDALQHYVNGKALTMLPRTRLDHLQACVSDVIARGVPGDLLEAGVWRGGATIFMRAIFQALGVRDRCVWAADSFEGLPEPDAQRFPKEAAAFHGPVIREGYQNLAVSLEAVQRNFALFGLLDAQVRFLPGWFRDTLPTAPVERLAVLRLDGDFHESTRDALVHLYGKVSPGGYVIVDDYGEDQWTECRLAVDDFRAQRGITEPIVQLDHGCWYWQRSG